MAVFYGIPAKQGYYTKICNLDYKSTIPIKRSAYSLGGGSNAVWDAKTNILTYPADSGSW